MTQKSKIDIDKLPPEVKAYVENCERIRRDFVANVSHELRTPLTVIRGYLETLIDQATDETQPWKKIFAQMYQHSNRMECLIEDLLLLSHLESTAQETTSRETIAVAKLLSHLIVDAKEISGELEHSITLQADKHLCLLGTEDELKSLFSNLIINAVKYTPAYGHITVKWFAEQDQAVFEVSDTGIGIAEKYIPRLTERFYRVDKARSRERGGTGLGLAIVKHVLLRHQGELTITSKLSKGSVFSCKFPKKRSIVIKSS